MPGSFTFESSTTSLPHMLGLNVSACEIREKSSFLPGQKERVLFVSFTIVRWWGIQDHLDQACRSHCFSSTHLMILKWQHDRSSHLTKHFRFMVGSFRFGYSLNNGVPEQTVNLPVTVNGKTRNQMINIFRRYWTRDHPIIFTSCLF